MIHDSLEQLHRYSAFLPAVDRVVAYLSTVDFQHLPTEKVYLDGENLFVIPSVAKGKKADEAKLEAHNAYADIQLCLSHGETFGWKDRMQCQQSIGEFDGEKDILFFEDKPSSFISLKRNEFVLFMPWDAHAPLIYDGEIVKLIFKLKVG